MKPHDLHNRLAGDLLKKLVRPVLANGGTMESVLVVLESIVVGVMLMFPEKPNGDQLRCLTLADSAAKRCEELRRKRKVN